MLIGQYEGIISEKRQIAFPKKFRQVLGDRLIVTKGLDTNLLIVSEENWKTFLEGTDEKPFIDQNTRQVQRYLFGNATELELDTKGRFILPEYLKDSAKIETEIIFAGVNKYVEVWSKQLWNTEEKALATQIQEIAQKVVGNDA
jgi:MraZ protein